MLLEVEALYALLCDRLAVLEPCAVAAVTRVFLEVSLLPCEERLWSLEFAFDQDDGRIARVVACFVDRLAKRPTEEAPRGYQVDMLLPRVLPPRAPSDGVELEGESGGDDVSDGALVARFERALVVLGAYRSVETIELVSVEAHLL